MVRKTIFYCTTHSLHFLSLLLYIELPVVCTQFSTSYVSGLAITSIYASLLNVLYVLCRLGENYEMVQGSCLPRSVLYTHYQDFCKKNQMEASSAASFGKVAQPPPPPPPPHTHTYTHTLSLSLPPSLPLSLSIFLSQSLSLSHTHTLTHTHTTHTILLLATPPICDSLCLLDHSSEVPRPVNKTPRNTRTIKVSFKATLVKW